MPVGTHWLKNHWAKKQSIATIYSTPETRATNPIAHHESWQQFYDNQFIDGALSMLILRRDLFVCLFRVVITERYVTNSSPYLRARGRGPFLRSHFHKIQCRGLGSCRESQCHLTAQEGICWYPKTGHCLWSHYIMIWYGSCRGGKKTTSSSGGNVLHSSHLSLIPFLFTAYLLDWDFHFLLCLQARW